MSISQFQIGDKTVYYDTATGQQVSGPNASAAAPQGSPAASGPVGANGLPLGQLATAEGTQAFVIGSDGKPVFVAPGEVQSLLSQGYKLPTTDQQAWVQNEQAFKNSAYYPTNDVAAKNVQAGGGSAPSQASSGATDSDRQNAIDYVRSLYPWLDQLGVTDDLRQWVAEGANGDAIVARIRNTSQYATRFVGIKRDDGTMRMNESQYLATEDSYRQLLKQYNHYDPSQDTPASYAAFFKGDIDPNELKDRLDTYDQIDRSSQDVKDAFYVYAGMKLTTDDLYNAVVADPSQGGQLQREYDARVAAQPIDYATWITRATEAGLNRVSDTLGRLQNAGVVGTTAVGQVAQIDPTFARDMMTALHNGSGIDGTVTRQLSLSELMNSFQYAMLGSAATSQGLSLPGTARLEALRQAGVTRTQAIDAYGQIASQQSHWQGSLQRAHLDPLDQADFERALLLHSGSESESLRQALSFDDSLRKGTGGAQFQQHGGQLAQPGLFSNAA